MPALGATLWEAAGDEEEAGSSGEERAKSKKRKRAEDGARKRKKRRRVASSDESDAGSDDEGGSRRSFGLLERYQKTPTAPLFKNIVDKVLEQLSKSRSQREADALEEPSQAS